MAEYEEREYLNMLLALGQAEGNHRRAVQIYAENYAAEGDRIPDYRIIHNLQARLLRGGQLVPDHNRGRFLHGELNYPPELEALVLAAVEDNPCLSTRVLAIRFELPNNHQLIHKILKDNGMHPYHYRKVQDMRQPRDFINRLNFCNNMFILHRRHPNLFQYILWTDECNFTPNGLFNSKNFVEWHDLNPRLIKPTKTQFRWTIHVWAGMIGEHLVIIFRTKFRKISKILKIFSKILQSS